MNSGFFALLLSSAEKFGRKALSTTGTSCGCSCHTTGVGQTSFYAFSVCSAVMDIW